MITIDIFLLGLLIISTLTSLVTEAVKKVLLESNVAFRSNLIAGIASLVLSTAVSICYIILYNIEFSAAICVCMLALMFMSWLCAMVGYDKVVQTIRQFTSIDKGE